MSDDVKKPAGAAQSLPGQRQTSGDPDQAETLPEDMLSPVDGEIDLARLAPQLRGLYQELLKEPIPDRFTKLLDELASKETDKK
jgi:hypothetical protein